MKRLIQLIVLSGALGNLCAASINGGTLTAGNYHSFVAAGAHTVWFDASSPAVVYRPTGGDAVQIRDAIYTATSGATYYTDYFWNYSIPTTATSGATIDRTSSNPAVIVPSLTEPFKWTRVSDGTATITMQCATRTLSRVVTTYTANLGSGAAVATITGFAPESLRYAIEAALTSSLTGHNSVYRWSAKSITDTLATTYFTDNANFVWHALDLSPVPAGTYAPSAPGWLPPGSGWGAGILVTPRHIIAASHWRFQFGSTYQDVGHIYYFKGVDGIVYKRTVVACAPTLDGYEFPSDYLPIGFPDLTVLRLDSDLPATVHPAKIYPENFASYCPTKSLPVLLGCITSGSRVSMIDELTGDTTNRLTLLRFNPVSSPFPYFMDPRLVQYGDFSRPGDSSSPVMQWVNGEPVVLCVTSSNLGGSSLSYWRDLINATITNLGSSGGYQLTEEDLSGFPSY